MHIIDMYFVIILIFGENMRYASKSLDHLGIVSGVCKKIGLVETIDNIIGADEQQIVTTGESVMAMVINALGFVSKPLYMFPDFMEIKPVKVLFRSGLESEDFNDDTLGRALELMNENIPNQVGKPTKKPTMRYVFQIFEGLEYLIIMDGNQVSYQVLNMKLIHRQILALIGPHYENIYLLKRACGR